MHPIAFELGSFTIRWYGIMAALGFLAATAAVNGNRKVLNMSADQASMMVFLATVSGVIGARIFYVIQFWRQFADRPLAVFRIDQGGLVFYGGLFLAILVLWIWSRRSRLDFVRLLDVAVPGILVGHAFGRIGCFLNGCCFGAPAKCFGVTYPEGSEPFLRYGGVPLYPVQLFEAGANLVLLAVFYYLVPRTKRGVVMSAYLIAYGVLRFSNEFFRGDHRDFLWGLTPAQTIGVVLIPLGLGLLLYFLKRPAPGNRAS